MSVHRGLALLLLFVLTRHDALAAPPSAESIIEIDSNMFSVPSRLRLSPAGFILWRRGPGPVDSTEKLVTFGLDGSRLTSSSVSVPGAAYLSVVSACMFSKNDPKFAVTVGFTGTDGALAHGVALLGVDGRVTRFMRTDHFVGDHVACDEDGNIWLFGRPYEWNFSKVENYPTVLKMTPTGKVLGAYLPRDSYDLEPAKVPSAVGRSGSGLTQFIASGDRIVIYSGITSDLIQLALDGHILSRSHIPGFEVTGMAVGPRGTIYATVATAGDRMPLFRFDALNATWAAVQGWDGAAQSLSRLIGSTDGFLVFRDGTNPARVLSVRAPSGL